VVRATSAYFGLHVDNVTFNTQTEEWIRTCRIIFTIMRVYFFIYRVQ
jgi:hypothetical protein